MAAKLTSLTHRIAIQLHLVAQSSPICSSRSRRPVRKLLDTPSYIDSGVFKYICKHYTFYCEVCVSFAITVGPLSRHRLFQLMFHPHLHSQLPDFNDVLRFFIKTGDCQNSRWRGTWGQFNTVFQLCESDLHCLLCDYCTKHS